MEIRDLIPDMGEGKTSLSNAIEDAYPGIMWSWISTEFAIKNRLFKI